MPALSIVMPVYNGAEFLPGTVASVFSQTCSDWELIIVDDGSTDGITPGLCDSYASHAGVRVFHKPNGGQSDARNYGLEHTEGTYIAFLDADDLLHPDFVRVMLETARETSADIVFGGFDLFRGDYRFKPLPSKIAPHCESPVEAVRKALYQTGYDNVPWGKIYRASLWKEMRFPKGLFYEDLHLFYRVALAASKVARIDRALYGYRQHGSSFMHTWSPRRLHVLQVVDDMVEWIGERRPQLLPAASDRRMSAYFNILLLLYKNRVRDAELELRCWQVIKAQRKRSLTDPHVRLKNRLGALVSMIGGRPLLRLLSGFAGV